VQSKPQDENYKNSVTRNFPRVKASWSTIRRARNPLILEVHGQGGCGVMEMKTKLKKGSTETESL
jgi:hypothetical protein